MKMIWRNVIAVTCMVVLLMTMHGGELLAGEIYIEDVAFIDESSGAAEIIDEDKRLDEEIIEADIIEEKDEFIETYESYLPEKELPEIDEIREKNKDFIENDNDGENGAQNLVGASMKTSAKGKEFIKSFESFRGYAYKAVASEKYYTIGYGHYGPDVYEGMTITQEEANALFEEDLVKYEYYVDRFLNKYGISVNQNQYDALVSFTYNLGDQWTATESFQLKTYLINGVSNYSDEQITTAFTNWNKSGQQELPGLTRRRKAEAEMFLERDSATKASIINLNQIYTNTNTINLQWTESTNATSYYIDVWKNGSEHVFSSDVGNTTSYALNCFGSDGSYGIAVSALNSAGITYGDYSYTNVLYVADLGENFCADIIFGSTDKAVSVAANNNVELQTQKGLYSQSWEFQRQADRSYKIISTNGTGRCLDDDNLGGSGANVAAVEDNGLSAQRWFIRESSGYYMLTPVCSPECSLDATNAGTSEGTNIQVYTTNYGDAQKFAIPKIAVPSSAPVFTLEKESIIKGEKLKVSWNKVQNARSYYIDVWHDGTHVVSMDVGNVTSYTLDCFDNKGSYSIAVSSRSPAGIKYGDYQYVNVLLSLSAEDTVVTGIVDKTYTGNAITQSPTVKIGSTVLASGTDYSLSYSNNKNAGNATVIITGKGNYTGSISKTFKINAASIQNATVTGISNKTYTGSAQTQNPTVKVGDKTLTSDTDYTLSYSNNTNAGTATVTITGKGNYSGSLSRTFTISAASISGSTVTGIVNKTYNGSALTQNPTVKVGDKTLTSGTDYTLSYSNNTNAGTATVTITGKGNYSGSLSKTFTISAVSITGATVTGISNKTYTGLALTQNPTVKVGDKTLTSGTDYTLSYSNNTNAGTATVTITGKGNYSGSVSKTFTISAASISGATVTGISSKTYTGSAQTQSPTVKMGEKTLMNNTDYTLSYSNNTNAGTATVTITGKGNYSGSLSKTFTIGGQSIANATVTGISNKTYTGSAQTQNPTVKVGDRTLTSGTDYTLSYSNNTNAGTATVTITGKGNYSGTVSKTYSIWRLTIANATVTGIVNKTYDGSVQTQTPSVKVNDKTLANGTDYTLSYSNNINAGTATVTITGKGNYVESVSKTFTISAASIAGATVTGISNKTYTGSAQTQSPTVKMGEKTLTSGTDYALSYSNNTNAGTATVTITGKGNYSGSVSKTFMINKAAAKLTFASTSISKTTLDGAFTNSLTKTTDGTVTFKSSNTAVAAVNSTSGQVTVKGTGTATITATAAEGTNYKEGSASYMVTVVDGRTDISGCTVTLSPASYTYNGKERKPSVTVTDGTATLTSGTDYTVTYMNNKNAGTATVTVAGTGSYTGTASKTFKINKAAAKLTFAESSVSKKTTDGTFTNTLTATTDGAVTFSSSDTGIATVDSSTGLVTIKGAGTTTITAAAAAGKNYKAGSAGYTLTVVDGRTDISGCTVTLSPASYTYNGKERKPSVTVTDGTLALTSGTDYTVTYTNNKNAGTATATVAGKGSYTGTTSKTFKINKAAAKLSFAESSVSKKTTDGAFTNTLTATTDGAVTFSSSNAGVAAVNSSTGLVTIKGAGTATITAAAAAGKNYKAGSTSYTLTVTAPASTGFSDVQDPSHPYYKAIYWAADAGITKGYSDGTFGIDRPCTRSEAVMFLWRLAGRPEPVDALSSPFSDVPKTHAHYKAILWASQKGITKGYSDGTFGINRTCTRGQIMTFIWRFKGQPAPKAVTKSPFSDVPKTHAYYKAILWGSQNGVTNGFSDGTFGVNKDCTRGQIVTFLYRIK